MKTASALLSIGLAIVLAAMGTPASAEPTRGKTADGIAFAMGGVTVSDLRALERDKDRFSLWITTAVQKSGAFLADVQVRITDGKDRVVFNQPIPGPWLFIDLPTGKYQVEASYRGKPQSRITQINKGDHHQVVFYFDDPAEVSPDWEKPFKDSPYQSK